MIKLFKKLVVRLLDIKPASFKTEEFDIQKHVQLPSDVRLTKGGNPDMRFNLLVGIDVTQNKDGTFDVGLSNMIFSSNGDAARNYIENARPDAIKQTAALCALVASKHIAANDTSAYTPAAVAPGTVDPLNIPPIDPKLLN